MDEVYAGLKELVRVGLLPASLRSAARESESEELRALLALDVFRDSGRAKPFTRVRDVLERCAARCDSETALRLEVLFGLTGDYVRMPYERRYDLAKEDTGFDYKDRRYFQKAADRWTRKLAEAFVLHLEEEVLLSTRRKMQDGTGPVNAAFAVHLLRQYESYYKIWSQVYGLSVDAALYLHYRSPGEAETEPFSVAS